MSIYFKATIKTFEVVGDRRVSSDLASFDLGNCRELRVLIPRTCDEDFGVVLLSPKKVMTVFATFKPCLSYHLFIHCLSEFMALEDEDVRLGVEFSFG